MKNLKSFIFLPFLLFAFSCSNENKAFTEYVNPFVGTDAHGHTFPGATAPFGQIQLSPDTRVDTWDGCSGYHYSDSVILGFSHTHLSGTGCLDFGDVLIMPLLKYDADTLNRDLYKSGFSHSRESASPGYYSVWLERWNVDVELAAGERVGMHSYDFTKVGEGEQKGVIIDLEHRDIVLDCDIMASGDSQVVGFRRSKAWNEDQTLYFAIEFSEPFREYKSFGKRGALLLFGPESGKVMAKVGISSVSSENAIENMRSEMEEGDFNMDGLLLSTTEKWNSFLSKIDVRGGDEDEERLRTFYTAFYHTAMAPSLYSDINGEYRGMDRKVYKAEGFDRYHIFSLWDTFRSLHPLFTIIDRERTREFIESFMTIYREGGKLPIWELGAWETNCMIGFNSVSVIADAVMKGIDEFHGFDVEDLLEAMIVSSKKDEFGIRYYRERYVVPAEKEHESVSKNLEYAYDDWCIAQVADYLYKKSGEERFAKVRDEYMKYSSSYINTFDPSTGFMRPVLSGSWLSPFEPREVNNHYTEANSWQYSFFVPHDVNGHIDLLGGDEAYCAKIDSLFAAPAKTSGRTQVDITGLVGQYAHGNEPSHHIAYLYSYAGKPWKCFETVRHILDNLYTSKPDGLCGNDDCGQMSAWYVLSSIGIYPVTPGSDIFVLTSPVFENVTISLENGEKFVIKSECTDRGGIDNNKYISEVVLNGKAHENSYIRFDDIMNGGLMNISLSAEPDKEFGSKREERPVSRGYEDFLRNPWFEYDSEIFSDSIDVRIAGADQVKGGATVYYMIKNLKEGESLERMSDERVASLQRGRYRKYSGEPIVIRKSSIICAYMEDSRGNRSPIISGAVYKLKDEMDIKTECEYNPQYNARGERGLIDGLRGSVNWKTGGWQGFQATDFVATVDLREVRRVKEIGSGYCQDARSWIWMPTSVDYFISEDGENFEKAGTVRNSVDPRDYNIQVKDFVLKLDGLGVKTRYIKVIAHNFGIIPEWHLGYGGSAFIFVDEIWVN